ncbi:MAG TPA: peptide chain release factor 2 [Firmicutes bacterium]|nr:peptide chain release factor 2 [Bacillota bacterium]
MELFEARNIIEESRPKVEKLKEFLKVDAAWSRAEEIREMMTREEIWSDQKKTKELGRELRLLEDTIARFQQIRDAYDEIILLADLLEEEFDPGMSSDLEKHLASFQKELKNAELQSLLSEKNDANNAYLEIHPGAGGTESQDWASMLMRMYQHWADYRKYGVEIIDYQDGEEAGIKSVTLFIKGPYAHGYLKTENGVHRLVRISPFDSNKRRHTSFASVFVYPELDDEIEIEINEKDLRIDTFRASGAGGQHINMTDSAVRITHLPTNIVVQCQNERSQIQNREQAFKMLKARLYQAEMEKLEAAKTQVENSKKDNAWGSQIRSYVLHPYKMIKDHRTNVETGNVDAVLDGDIDMFIFCYLEHLQRAER